MMPSPRTRQAYFYTAAILATALLVVPSFWAFRQMKVAARERQYTHDTLHQAEVLRSTLADAETGQRGFLITGDDSFLEPYTKAQGQLQEQLSVLRRRTLSAQARVHLDTVAPLVEAKQAELAQVIGMRRGRNLAAMHKAVQMGQGQWLMDAIRLEMAGVVREEKRALAEDDAAFQSLLGRLSAIIAVVGGFTLLTALAFVRALQRQTHQRLRDMVHHETRHLLETQEATSERLLRTNETLQESEANLSVTLNSIGDAVIATDAAARIRLLNPVAERLTGWPQAEATGHHIDEVFRIINQETRVPAAAPILDTLAHGTVQGLANHTLLIARDGTECAIADSCAPIRALDGAVVGAVLVFRDVTKEYAAQASLRDSSALLQAILNTVVDGILTIRARDGVIETINPAVEQMFGRASGDLLGRGIELLIPQVDLANTEAAPGTGREVVGRRKNGELFPLEMALSDMWLGGERYYTGILRDISALKQAEEALVKAGALQNAIFTSANFSSIATDAKGVIQIFNVGAERMLGFTAVEVMNKITPADISDPQEVISRAEALTLELGTPITPGFEALVFKASRGIEDIYELTYIRKDGSRFPAVVSVTALRDAEGAIIGYLLIGTDNTARMRVEEERERLDRALQDRNAELVSARIVADQANLAKSEFLSSMSHELRSPLNAILGFAQLMDSATPPASPAQKGSIERILHAGWYLLELINEILDLSVIESGKFSISEEPVSLAEVMHDCKSIIEPQAMKRGIKLTFPHFEVPLFVRADRIRLKQVLINLLSNAVKYNHPEGTVVVTCAAGAPGRMRISVQDTGQGLAPEQLRQLFQPFNRLGQEHSSEEGTGIGLVMSKLLVELMGGKLGVESRLGEGSLFWYELNTAEPSQLAETHSGDVVVPQSMASGIASRTVLCVEDNPANLDLIRQLLARRPDLLLLCADDAHKGLAMAREHRPEIILMDINLPGMNGLEALQILRADPITDQIPVIAISANAMVGDIQRGLESGFFRYLTKPIKVSEFMGSLDEALELIKITPVATE